jgi:SPP1 gp7 family putative phage head morphogenesis protein
MAREYWQDRMQEAQNRISSKSVKQIEKQLIKYYKATAKEVMAEFEDTYMHLQNTIAKDKEPTPADLYKLQKYWEMQGQLKKHLQELGDKEIELLSRQFETNFFEVYYSLDLGDNAIFNTLDTATVKQMINQIWVADGKSWSERIWEDTNKLAATLNEELIYTVASGKTTGDLKHLLQDRFNVSYSRADALVRTELAHIQTQAAQQRYVDAGVKEMMVWADYDERRCEVCGKLHKQTFPIGAKAPIPAHPRCRCCIVPVI